MDASHVCQVGAQLGEGPVWVERDSALWFVDIKARRVHRWHPGSGEPRAWAAPDQPGFLAPLGGGGFIVGLKTGLSRFDPQSSEFVHLLAVEPDRPENRLNDGTVSPEGELWFGSMHDTEAERTGALYRLDADGRCVCLDKGYIITNGPAFSPDGSVFYHTATSDRTVYAFDRPDPHTLLNKRVFVRIEEGAGHPDGTAVDQEGCVWIALYGGWGVRRYSPQGKLLATVRVPCANVTKIAFGGPDLRTAYATTAWAGLTQEQRAAQPLAGDLFSFEAPAPGLRAVEARFVPTRS
ncbi:MAG TPA: SMP-30/gluconolactonase/LRE family protein [Steroidobacteraceae bacterium]|nr:SMP-30/gluconolactonase/LRE family protein [Steroidobacteraceae bacterium]